MFLYLFVVHLVLILLKNPDGTFPVGLHDIWKQKRKADPLWVRLSYNHEKVFSK